MDQLFSSLFKAIRKVRGAPKRIGSTRFLVNSPVLLVALSVSLAAAYGTLPRPAPSSASASNGKQQLTTTQAQPTSGVVEVSEPTPNYSIQNQSVLGVQSTLEAPTSQEISPPATSDANYTASETTASAGTEPTDDCATSCTQPTPPSYPAYGCGSCYPGAPKSDSTNRCANMLCTD